MTPMPACIVELPERGADVHDARPAHHLAVDVLNGVHGTQRASVPKGFCSVVRQVRSGVRARHAIPAKI